MFAPAHHQATRYVIPVRRELAVRTIFNFLGPLTNPAGATRQLIGVSDPAYLETMAGALALLGTRHALLVSSEDGLDELSISAPTHGRRGARRGAAPLHGHARGGRRSTARRRGRSPAATRSRTPHTARRIFAGEHGRGPRPRGAERRRGDLRRRRRGVARRRACAPPRRRSTAAPRRQRSSGSSPGRGSWRREPSRADRRRDAGGGRAAPAQDAPARADGGRATRPPARLRDSPAALGRPGCR